MSILQQRPEKVLRTRRNQAFVLAEAEPSDKVLLAKRGMTRGSCWSTGFPWGGIIKSGKAQLAGNWDRASFGTVS